ncbi:MAG: protein kinase [Acidobacteriota bacterium]
MSSHDDPRDRSAGRGAPGPDEGVTRLPSAHPAPGADAPTFAGAGGAGPADSHAEVPGDAEAAFAPGRRIGTRYTIIKQLGRGGMGAVYQAWDDELTVAVAIKVILADASTDPSTRHDAEQRFKRELLLARQVSHRNVVRIHDIGDVGGVKYITMALIEGETLAALMRRMGPLPVEQALALMGQVAEGLAAAHDVGVVHRDLKPENIMVTPDGRAVIMDFGIARSTHKGTTQTQAGSILGTLEYMAPEQASGQPVDQRVDVYALGLIAYDMLLGRHRVTVRDNPMTELMDRVRNPPAPPRATRPDVPSDFEEIILRAVQPEASARYATSAELKTALDALDAAGRRRPDLPPAAAPPRPSRLPLAIVGAAAIVVLGLGGMYVWRESGPAAPSDPPPAVSVLIADFDNRTGDAVFDGVVEQALTLGVESASFVTTYPRREALRTAALIKPGAALDVQTARLVALREGVQLVLAGAVEPRGGGYRISARALGPDEASAPLYELTADANGKATVLERVGELAGKVREALGDTTVPSGGPVATETFTAASLEAARAYAAAQELQWTGRVEDAIGMYQKTIELDPQMGRAYSGLAAQYQNLGRMAEAERHYKQALALIDRMTDREKYRTRGSYFLFARNPSQAIQEFTALVKAYPSDSVGLSNLALARFYQRDMAAALEQGQRAADLFPRNVLRRANLALYAMYAGDFETAIAQSLEAHTLNPTHLKSFVARALSQLALGRGEEAAATYGKLRETSDTAASFAVAGLADLAHVEGRLADARALLADGIAADVAAKNMTGAATKRVALAEVLLAAGDSAGAAREALAGRAASDVDNVQAGAALVLAAAGRSRDAESVAVVLDGKLEVDPQAYARLIRAEIALAAGQARAALDHARAAQKLADTWLGRVTLGRAYLAAGAFPEAYAELEAALRRKGEATAVFLDDVPTYRLLPPVHYYLGVAQEGLKSPAAAESFTTFLAIKAKSDGTGTLVAEARKKLGR